MNAWIRLFAVGVAALATLLLIPVSASAAPAAAGSQGPNAVVNAPSTSDRCVNSNHTVPCWALTFHAGQGNQGCPNGVPFFLRSGGKICLGGNDLVLITCWFTGNPVVGGDSIQDHVTEENAGGLNDIGHIPDFYIDLNGHNPGDAAIGIPHC